MNPKPLNTAPMSTIAAAAISVLALACAAAVAAEPRLPHLSVGDLKTLFLACDRVSMQGLMGAADAAQCSIVYEDLKARAFDGDFEKLLAWSREQHRLRQAAL
jgi:hypothetical protein